VFVGKFFLLQSLSLGMFMLSMLPAHSCGCEILYIGYDDDDESFVEKCVLRR
jgi:hypothetical protein